VARRRAARRAPQGSLHIRVKSTVTEVWGSHRAHTQQKAKRRDRFGAIKRTHHQVTPQKAKENQNKLY